MGIRDELGRAMMQAVDLIADAIEKGQREDDWVDQYHSPLGRRRHCELVRKGTLEGYKPDRKHVYVRRGVIDAYLQGHPAKPGPRPPASPSPEPKAPLAETERQKRVATHVAKASARLGLVRVR